MLLLFFLSTNHSHILKLARKGGSRKLVLQALGIYHLRQEKVGGESWSGSLSLHSPSILTEHLVPVLSLLIYESLSPPKL